MNVRMQPQLEDLTRRLERVLKRLPLHPQLTVPPGARLTIATSLAYRLIDETRLASWSDAREALTESIRSPQAGTYHLLRWGKDRDLFARTKELADGRLQI